MEVIFEFELEYYFYINTSLEISQNLADHALDLRFWESRYRSGPRKWWGIP